jgi:hypothetical protein
MHLTKCVLVKACCSTPLLHLLLALQRGVLGDVGEHGGALGRFEVLGARLLEQSLWLRPANMLAYAQARL